MKTEYGNEDMFSAPGFLSRMDFGVRAGAGFVIRRIYLGISYDIGCRDLFRAANSSATHSSPKAPKYATTA